MAENQRVSVIVITYNSQKTIIETLDSIYNQTHKDIELIVSDDCSIDDTLKVVNEWLSQKSERFSNTRVIVPEKNTGVAENCNRGVQAISTEYYKLIAGDDLLEPTAIQEYVRFVVNNPNQIAVAKVRPFGDVEEQKLNIWMHAFEKGYDKLKYPFRKKYRELCVRNFICASAVGLIHKEWYEKTGGFSKEYPLYEDHPMYIKWMELGYDFVLLDSYIVKYRVSNSSLSGNRSNRFLKNVLKFFWKENALRILKNGDVDEFVMQVVYYGLMTMRIKLQKG